MFRAGAVHDGSPGGEEPDSSDGVWLGFKEAFLAIFWAYDGWYLYARRLAFALSWQL